MNFLHLSVSHTRILCSHKAIMDVEIEFLHNNLTKENSKKLLMEHIERMASGEAPSENMKNTCFTLISCLFNDYD